MEAFYPQDAGGLPARAAARLGCRRLPPGALGAGVTRRRRVTEAADEGRVQRASGAKREAVKGVGREAVKGVGREARLGRLRRGTGARYLGPASRGRWTLPTITVLERYIRPVDPSDRILDCIHRSRAAPTRQWARPKHPISGKAPNIACLRYKACLGYIQYLISGEAPRAAHRTREEDRLPPSVSGPPLASGEDRRPYRPGSDAPGPSPTCFRRMRFDMRNRL
jgi:hypothetical protein